MVKLEVGYMIQIFKENRKEPFFIPEYHWIDYTHSLIEEWLRIWLKWFFMVINKFISDRDWFCQFISEWDWFCNHLLSTTTLEVLLVSLVHVWVAARCLWRSLISDHDTRTDCESSESPSMVSCNIFEIPCIVFSNLHKSFNFCHALNYTITF